MKTDGRNKNKIEKIVVCHEIDDQPDTSFWGKYTNNREEWNINRKTGEYCYREYQRDRLVDELEGRITYLNDDGTQTEKVNRLQKRIDNLKEIDFRGYIERGEYQYFEPYARGEKKGSFDYKKNGKQDYERMESLNRGDFCFIGIIAKAEIYVNDTRQTITSGGLWGIESDGGKKYIAEVEREQLDELAENLKSLGFGPRAIKYAVNNHETKE